MITLTDAASIQIKEMMKDAQGNPYLHFGVMGGGCSGLSYVMNFCNDVEIGQTLHEINDIFVIITDADASIIKDTVVDYKQNMLGGGFTIENPNAIASCGCGTSFRTKKEVGKPTDC